MTSVLRRLREASATSAPARSHCIFTFESPGRRGQRITWASFDGIRKASKSFTAPSRRGANKVSLLETFCVFATLMACEAHYECWRNLRRNNQWERSALYG